MKRLIARITFGLLFIIGISQLKAETAKRTWGQYFADKTKSAQSAATSATKNAVRSGADAALDAAKGATRQGLDQAKGAITRAAVKNWFKKK